MWNMQSGKERRSFSLTGPPPGDTKPGIIASAAGKAKSKAKAKKLAAEKSIQAVTGIVTDSLNTVVVISTLEGKLYVSVPLFPPGLSARVGEEKADVSSSTSIQQNYCTSLRFPRRSLLWSYIVIADCYPCRVTISQFAWLIWRRGVLYVSCGDSRDGYWML